jgi:hypothetical protein
MTYLGLHQSSNQRVDQTRLQSFGLSGPGCSSPFNKPSGLSVEVLANLFHRFLSAQSRLLPTSSTNRLICQSRFLPTPSTDSCLHSRGYCQPLQQTVWFVTVGALPLLLAFSWSTPSPSSEVLLTFVPCTSQCTPMRWSTSNTYLSIFMSTQPRLLQCSRCLIRIAIHLEISIPRHTFAILPLSLSDCLHQLEQFCCFAWSCNTPAIWFVSSVKLIFHFSQVLEIL